MRAQEVRPARCPSCGYAAPVDAVIKDLCPRCLSPLSSRAGASADVAPATSFENRPGVVADWVDAFNARELDRMLAHMSPDVEFHPLRLGRVDACYHGHDGVRQWFARIIEDERAHHLEVTEFRDAGANRLIALGTLRVDGGSDRAPFWALDRFNDLLIASAHHYLTDADILEHGRLFDL